VNLDSTPDINVEMKVIGFSLQHCISAHFIHGYNIHHIILHLVVGHFRNVFFMPLI
jgi:hypothetical protein